MLNLTFGEIFLLGFVCLGCFVAGLGVAVAFHDIVGVFISSFRAGRRQRPPDPRPYETTMKKIGTALYYAGVLIVLVTALAGEISGYGVVIALIGFVLVAWYPFRSATMITRRRKG